MIESSIYLLDANVFIEASRVYYSFDIAPPFWEFLLDSYDDNKLLSIDKIKVELLKGKDELADWVKDEFGDAFATTDEEEIVTSFSELMEWVQGNDQFTEEAKTEFASVADGWLIAVARVKGYTLVTQEVYNPDVKKRVPIPNVCKEFGVRCENTFTMLRKLEFKF